MVVPFVGLANHVLKFVTTAGPVIADSSHDNCNWNPVGHAIFVETQYPYMLYRVFHFVLISNSASLDRAMIVRSIVDHPAIALSGFFLDNLSVLAIHQIVPT